MTSWRTTSNLKRKGFSMRATKPTFPGRIRENLKTNTSGELHTVSLSFLMNSPALLIAAEQYADGAASFDDKSQTVGNAIATSSKRFNVTADNNTKAIAETSGELEPLKHGFTLVELSIVLVIIGLLIGGILVAQSMISTSKITAQVAQIQQFDAEVMNFTTKYNYLPGDAPAFGGDGNGIIAWTGFAGGASYNQVYGLNCEIGRFWYSMAPQEYADSGCGFSSVKASTTGQTKNVPAAKIGKPNSFFIASAMGLGDTFADTSNVRNFYALLDPSQTQTPPGATYPFAQTTSANSAVKPADLLALDTKMDDGIANTGNVLSGSTCCGGYAGIYPTPLSTCSQGATYEVQNDSYECTPLIRIGAQTGAPQ
jgi:prepilin-type N-terminal cleavage/methylation domain-containing protein